MGCFGSQNKRNDSKKRKIRYEGIEVGGKVHTLECSTPMPDEQEVNTKFAELVVSILDILVISSILLITLFDGK